MAGRSTSYGERGERRVDRALAALRRRQVEPHVPAGGVVLDLGCGHGGDLLARLAPRIREGIGVDVSVRAEPPAPNVRLLTGAADAELPLPSGSVDLVTCLAVIEHVDRPETLLAEARRVLRDGGRLVLTTPSREAKPVLELVVRLRLIDAAEILDHKRYYAPRELRAALAAAGFAPAGTRVRRFELGLNLAAVAEAR